MCRPMHADSRSGPDRSWLAPVLLLSLARVLFHLFTHRGYGMFRDELYYLACARHLDFGYVDHPPLAPALLRLVQATLGDSLFAIRLLPALAAGLTVWLVGFLCHTLGGQRIAAGVACLSVALAPVLLAFGHIYSMNVFEPLFFLACTIVLVRIAQGASARHWLWFGVVAGLGLENKHSMLFFGFAALLATLTCAELRRTLRTPWPWLSFALALALFAPNLVWQGAHGFPTLEFMDNARAHKNLPLSPGAFMLEQLLQAGPLAAPVWLLGLWLGLFARDAPRGARLVAVLHLTLLAVFLLTQAKPYYLAASYPALFASGGVMVERMGKRVAASLSALVLVTGVLCVPLVVPVLGEQSYVAYAEALGVEPGSAERQELGALPQFYADMHGWEQLARDVAKAWSRLPESERKECAIFANNYGEAGAIDYFGPALGLPRALAGHNSYWLWGPGDASGECVLVIGGDPEDHARAYHQVDVVGASSDPWRMPYENVTLYLLRGPRVPLRDLWPRVKHYI